MALPRSLDDAGVSAREAEVLDALGQHLTNAEIASGLFISVRTVESHVSSLLRKLGLSDRRELAQLAAQLAPAEVVPGGAAAGTGAGTGMGVVPTTGPAAAAAANVVPAPLTPFVGRATECETLATLLGQHRLITAVGPGGIGKTRLALAVASELTDRYAGGVWYVDLVPVTDPAMIAPSVASVLGLGEIAARSADDAVVTALADRDALLVLDNCEHLADGAAVFVEGLLARCRRLTVLTTSRARLLVPFEHVFPVPGLSLPDGTDGTGAAGVTAVTRPTGDDDDGLGDAVALFLARAAAVGNPVTSAADRRRVAAICRALDGLALAIELAAARLPALGLDGLEAGLGDRLRLLAGGSRLDDRHSSLRAALDWSYDLLDPVDEAVLRRLAVFAAPFTVDAAVAVAGFGPLPPGKEAATTVDALGHLADQSLVVVLPGRDGTRYRVLETIRQYGMARLDDAGESDTVRDRHLRWCLTVARELAREGAQGDVLRRAELHGTGAGGGTGAGVVDRAGGEAAADPDGWRAAFDAVADDLRAALGWVAHHTDRHDDAHTLALQLGDLLVRRGLLAEAQRRYEQAAAYATSSAGADASHQVPSTGGSTAAAAPGSHQVPATAAVSALRHAAGAAASRESGDDALRLHQEAAAAARAAGDRAGTALNLALAAMLAERCPGMMTRLPPPFDVAAVLDEARALAGDDAAVQAAVMVAEGFAYDGIEPGAEEHAQRTVAMARQAGDPLLESAALDHLTAVHLARCEPQSAVAAIRRRTELLTDVPLSADSGHELCDGYHMAVEVHIGVGDLRTARQMAELLLRLPAYQEGHLAAARLVVADALAGDWDGIPEIGARFRADWDRLGRPMVSHLAFGSGAVALVHGLRGDEDAWRDWLELTATLRSTIEAQSNTGCNTWPLVFDAIVLLHRGQADDAVATMTFDPDELHEWHSGLWRQWYTALWAEAAVQAGHPEAAARLERARDIVAGNPIATALVARAEAWSREDTAGLLAAADALAAAGSRYQQARTLVLARGDHRTEGETILASLGATPMTVPAPPR